MNDDLALESHATPIAALTDSTVGVAVFDEGFRCTALNPVLALLSGEPAEAHLGKTISEICGCKDPAIDAALVRVFCTGEPLRNLEVTARPSGKTGGMKWVADFFPVRDAQWGVNMVGAAISDRTATNRLRRYFDGRVLLLPDLLWRTGPPFRDFSLMLSKYREVCRQSVNLMNRCMAIRRQVSELHIATRLSRAATAITIRQQQQRHAYQHRERLRYFNIAPERRDTLKQNDPYIPPVGRRKESPSPREAQVLRLVAEGKSNKQIGVDLRLSTRTIETYRARLMNKLKMHSAAELIRYAVRNNLVRV